MLRIDAEDILVSVDRMSRARWQVGVTLAVENEIGLLGFMQQIG